jgi:site-specific recombinase XerD
MDTNKVNLNNPVELYLNSLGGADSARVCKSGLDYCARVISGGKDNAYTLDWSQVKFPQVSFVRSELIKKYSPATANRIICNLRKVLEYCWLLNFISADDYQRAIRIAPVIGERADTGRSLEKSEIRHMIELCDFDTNFNKGMRDKSLISMMYSCGLRRGETILFQIKDYNKIDKTILIHGKRNKQVVFNLMDDVIENIERWLDVRGRDEGFLFNPITLHGRILNKKMTTAGIYYIIKTSAENAGIVGKVSPHDIRRSFASHLLENKTDVFTVCSLMRHANINTTMRYDKRNKENLKLDALKTLNL